MPKSFISPPTAGTDSIGGLQVSVTAGSTDSIRHIKAPAAILVKPGAGGTMTVKVRVTSKDSLIDLDPDNTSYSTATLVTLMAPVFELVFGAVTEDGGASVAIWA